MSDESVSSLEEYVNTTIAQIEKGIPNHAILDGSIRFEMATVGQKDKSGKLSISVLNIGAGASESQIQKVSFSVKRLTETEIAKDAAEKARADASKRLSERFAH